MTYLGVTSHRATKNIPENANDATGRAETVTSARSAAIAAREATITTREADIANTAS